jgi:hypothetical protein
VVGLLVALNGLSLWASFIFLRLLLFPAWLRAPCRAPCGPFSPRPPILGTFMAREGRFRRRRAYPREPHAARPRAPTVPVLQRRGLPAADRVGRCAARAALRQARRAGGRGRGHVGLDPAVLQVRGLRVRMTNAVNGTKNAVKGTKNAVNGTKKRSRALITVITGTGNAA